MNTKEAVVPTLVGIAVILSTALILPIDMTQTAFAADDDDDSYMMMDSNTNHIMKGQISNVQLDDDGKPAWIQSGIWVLRVFPTADSEHPEVLLVAKMQMIKPDGTAMHSHSIFNYQVSDMTQKGNTTTFEGTATVTMKDGPVTDVPLTIKIFNNAVMGMWIDPDKTENHFGSNPIYGTLAVSSKAMMTMPKMMGGMAGQGTSSTAGESNTIKMSAKEVDEVYRWSTSDGTNPTLKMVANTNNIVQIDNPTDEKHELVIESADGKELASSGDIGPDSSGQLVFKPTTTGTFEYHCEYHPDTMKGTIEVAPSSS